MDRNGIEDLFAYTEFSFARHAAVMESLAEGAFAAPVPGSGWPSFQECFTHFVSAYDGWINGEWALALGEMTYPGPEGLSTWDAMAAYRERTRAAFRNALEVPDEALFAKKTYDFGEGEESLSRADILSNLLVHERGHHGDMNTLFYQAGIKAPIVDYRYFISFPDRVLYDEGDDD